MPGMSSMSDGFWPAMSIFGMALAPFSAFWSCARRTENNSSRPERSTAYRLDMVFPAYFSTNPARQELFYESSGSARQLQKSSILDCHDFRVGLIQPDRGQSLIGSLLAGANAIGNA